VDNTIALIDAYTTFGTDIDPGAHAQMRAAISLPVAVAGALMPDAHVGYGLPIGGVLACNNAIIPYAVGVDIACRMRLSVFDVPAAHLDRMREQLSKILLRETTFGTGATQRHRVEHAITDDDWACTPCTERLKDKAISQLGTSGSGNHFVEFGTLTLEAPDLGLEAGSYLAVLSHSGSRGAGAQVAQHYSNLAMRLRPDLPKEQKYLAWLDLDSDEGREYFAAMNLMGRYAAANHAVIHRLVERALGERVMATVENHHNFAWIEEHAGRKVVVHRKGATPAHPGTLGVIPGSMSTPGFVVRGKAGEASIGSASHGAGRLMSRTQARNTFRWNQVKPQLEAAGVTLLSAGIDENPNVYKNIHDVMQAQQDLVDVVARFDPKVVRMADDGERPED
jgi:tRNA-splicing ligase RtcB